MNGILKEAINRGVLHGMKESLIALNEFINRKEVINGAEYITRSELHIFMNQYIELTKAKKEDKSSQN